MLIVAVVAAPTMIGLARCRSVRCYVVLGCVRLITLHSWVILQRRERREGVERPAGVRVHGGARHPRGCTEEADATEQTSALPAGRPAADHACRHPRFSTYRNTTIEPLCIGGKGCVLRSGDFTAISQRTAAQHWLRLRRTEEGNIREP